LQPSSAPARLLVLSGSGEMGPRMARVERSANDNTEGGTHDTRFCFIGEWRLEELERQLPAETASRVFKTGQRFGLDELRGLSAGRAPKGPDIALSRAGDKERLSQRIVELEAELAAARDRAQLVEPLILQLLDIRRMARDMEEYAAADAIRDRLIELGIEVQDSAGGTDFVVS
jgi:hypothetical protein